MAALVRFCHCEKEGEHVKDNELGLGPFRSAIIQPFRRVEDGTPPGPAKLSVGSDFDIHKQFHAQKVLSMESMLQLTEDPC
jgi:hypothetical protein